MTRSVFQRYARNQDGEAIPSAEVDVVITDGPVADIFAAETGGSAIPQPLIADANGYFRFYVEPGLYDVTATDPVLFSSTTFDRVEIGASRETLIDDDQHVSPYSSLNKPDAVDVNYDNSASSLTAIEVQSAIDEVNDKIDSINDTTFIHEFDTVALMNSSGIIFPLKKTIITKGDITAGDGLGATFLVANSSSTPNDETLNDGKIAVWQQRLSTQSSYDNSLSGLDATEVQSALDEVAESIPTLINDHDVNTNSHTFLLSSIQNLEDNQQSGVIVFQTLALLEAYTPTASQETGSFKVANDGDALLNGYYSWVTGTTYIKDASLVQNNIDNDNTSDAVSGFSVRTFVQSENVAPITPNLFDVVNAEEGILIETSGAETPNPLYRTSDYIAVEEFVLYKLYRQDFSNIIAGRARKTCYYDSQFNVVAGGSNLEVSEFTPPANVAFIRIGTLEADFTGGKQTTLVKDADHPVPALHTYYAKTLLNEAVATKTYAATVEEEGGASNSVPSLGTVNTRISDAIDAITPVNVVPKNYITGGDYILSDADMRGASIAVDLSTQQELLDRGYTRGINWTLSNDFARGVVGSDIDGKYITGGFLVYSDTPANISVSCTIFSENGANAIDGGTVIYSGSQVISAKTNFLFTQIQVTQVGAVNALVGAITAPVDSTRYATGFVGFVTDTPISKADFLRYFSSNDTNRLTAKKYSEQSGNLAGNRASASFNGSGLTVITGTKYKREILPFKPELIESSRVFNFVTDYIGNTIAHGGSDNVAPIHANGTTLLANHAYNGCKYIATAHGKSNSDIGSLYSNGGDQYVLTQIIDANTLWLADTVSNSTAGYPSNDTFTFVSGGVTSNNIAVTTATPLQMFPCHTDYSMNVIVDGVLFDGETGVVGYNNEISFNQTTYLMSRDDIIAWYISSGDASLKPVGPKQLLQNVSYRFDWEGNCTIVMDYTAMDIFTMSDILGMQSSISTSDSYYIPKTVSFTHQAVPLNFSMIEPSDSASSGGGSSIFFTSEKLDASPIKSDRWLMINSVGVFAMGFLPVGSAGVNRATNVTTFTAEIRGNTDKMYPRLLDKSDFSTVEGDSWGGIGYSIVHTPYPGSTATYPVRTNGDDYYFIDYHNTDELVAIPMPDDYIGRDFEVVESRNITAVSAVISQNLACLVSCTGDYGYLVLKVKR